MSTSFGRMFWRNHSLVASFVIVNYDFILWEFHETFSIITCAGLNLLYGPERANYMMRGRGAGGRGCCLLSLLLLSLSNILLLLPSPPETLSINDCPRKWCSSSSAMIGNVLGRNPNCKIFFKILELLCILTKPKFFSNKLTRTHVGYLHIGILFSLLNWTFVIHSVTLFSV